MNGGLVSPNTYFDINESGRVDYVLKSGIEFTYAYGNKKGAIQAASKVTMRLKRAIGIRRIFLVHFQTYRWDG